MLLAHESLKRLRLAIPVLKRDPQGAAALRARVGALDGVVTATASPLTGSLVVHHDGAAQTRAQIFGKLKEWGYGSVTSLAPHPVQMALPSRVLAARHRPAVAEIVANALLDRLVELTIQAMVAAVI